MKFQAPLLMEDAHKKVVGPLRGTTKQKNIFFYNKKIWPEPHETQEKWVKELNLCSMLVNMDTEIIWKYYILKFKFDWHFLLIFLLTLDYF